MNTLELKGSILELLANVQDTNVLVKIKQILTQATPANSSADVEPEWLTDVQAADLKKALEEIKEGQNLVPHKEAMQKFRTWSKQ